MDFKNYLVLHLFFVARSSEKYKLTVGGYTGRDDDYFAGSNEPANNSTLDRDNDLYENNCAVHSAYQSGWCFHRCVDINPNAPRPYYNWPNTAEVMEMKIHLKDCVL